MNSKSSICYGIGGLGKNIAFTIVSTYILYYYNVVMGMSASFIGTVLLFARIFDAFNDPIMGVVVEKTKSRFGKYKPWILSGAILNALTLYAIFSAPEELSKTPLKWYLIITYLLCGITYTLSDISYWSIIPAITQAGKNREKVSIVARTFTGVGSGAATAFTMMAVVLFGGGIDKESYHRGFSIVAGIVAIFYIITTVIAVVNIPDEVGIDEKKDASNQSVKHLIKALLANDQAIILTVIIILFYCATTLTLNTVIYEFDYDLLTPNRYSSFMLLVGIAQLVGMTILYVLLRKIMSNRSVFFVACFFALLGYFIYAGEIPMTKLSYGLLLFPGLLIGLANGLVYVLITVFVADAVDYGEKLTGIRENSMVSSLQTLMVKFSSAIAALVVGIGIDLVNFTGPGPQPEAVIDRLHVLLAIPPMFFAFTALVLMIKRKDIGIEK